MKIFLVTLLVSFLLIWGFMLFGGAVLLQNIWFCLLLIALPVAIAVSLCIRFDEKITALQKRIEALENPNPNDNSEK